MSICSPIIAGGTPLQLCLSQNRLYNPDLPIEAFFTYWADPQNGCPEAAGIFANSLPSSLPNTCTIGYNSDAMTILQNHMSNEINVYLKKHKFTDDVLDLGYSPVQNIIRDICLDPTTPGICDKFLGSYCSQYSRDQVASSQILTSFCGCYIPVDPLFQQYAKGTPACLTGDVVNCTGCTGDGNPDNCVSVPACDPLCKLPMTVKKVSDQGRQLTCPQNVCVIDNITINQHNSEITGGINFNTICAGCLQGSGLCLCVINSPQSSLSEIGVANYIQMCGSGSTCLVNGEVVPCTNFDQNLLPLPPATPVWLWGLLFFGLLILGLVILIGIVVKLTRT